MRLFVLMMAPRIILWMFLRGLALNCLSKLGGGYIVVNQSNSGVSASRNNGLSHAKGDYVWFIDSDDYIQPDCLSSILKILYNNKLDFVKVESNSVSQNAHPAIEDIERDDLIEKSKWDTFTMAWMLIVSRDYILRHQIEFNENMAYAEDILWVFRVGMYNSRYKMFANKFYNYRQRSGSAMNNFNMEKHLKSLFVLTLEYKNILDSFNEEDVSISRKSVEERLYWSIQSVLFDALTIGSASRKEYLIKMKKEKLYPYPILWEKITMRNGFKSFLINLFCLFFPKEFYYKSAGRLYDILRR